MHEIPLSENHRRSVCFALKLFDEVLEEAVECAEGREREGVLFRDVNPLGPEQRKALLRAVADTRRVLTVCREQFALPVIEEDVSTRVWGKFSALWEVLVETTSKHLRRYGDVPEPVAHSLDPKIEELIRHLIAMVQIVNPPH